MSNSDFVTIPPPMESPLRGDKGSSSWPTEIQDNPHLQAQVMMRKNLHARLDSLFQQIPQVTIDISDAIDSKLVDPESVASMYELLGYFLDADTCHRRLVLYLPFEFLYAQTQRPQSEMLGKTIAKFTDVYLKRWNEMLEEEDVRANFVDGDILEPELAMGPPPRVVKAAHLIPRLVEKGLISVSSIIDIMENNSNDTLRESIADTLPVLEDMSLLTQSDWRRLLASNNPWMRAKVRFIIYTLGQNNGCDRLMKPHNGEYEKNQDLVHRLASDITKGIEDIQKRYVDRQSKRIPKARIDWERQDQKDKLISKYAYILANAIINNQLSADTLRELTTLTSNTVQALAGIRGIGKAVEMLAKDDMGKARVLYSVYEPLLYELWQKDTDCLRDELISVWSRLASIGVVGRSYLAQFGIEVPKLDSLFSSEGKLVIEKEARKIALIMQCVESYPQLSRFIYPVSILFGSRLKGYATESSDLDVAIFVRPSIAIHEQPELRKFFSQIFSRENIQCNIFEFWLAQEGHKLYVQDIQTPDMAVADSMCAHILFGGAWCGKKGAIKELYEKLLSGYLFSGGKKIGGYDARKLWLGEIEREVLQYRLMHKGYWHYYAEQGGVRTAHSGAIDPNSAFWDSGYRRLATKLFVSRVFLPQLSK